MISRIRTLDEALSTEFDSLSNCYKEFWNDLSHAISSLDVRKVTAEKSKSFKLGLMESTESIASLNWYLKEKERDRSGPFKLDGFYSCSGNCGSKHFVNIVLCLFNREAIGTNFLKLEAAALKNIRFFKELDLNDDNVIGLLITFDRNFLESENYPNWDSSYADATEYKNAYKNYYKSLIRSNIISMRLHLS